MTGVLASGLVLAATFTRTLERVNSMDPADAQAVYDSKAVQLVYETPLTIDYAARPYKLIPGLCELPEVSSNGLVYTFAMVDDAPLTAYDVKRQLDRVRDPAAASPGGWTLKNVSSIDAPDSRRFVVTLKTRQFVFPWMMAITTSAVPDAKGRGTGPYRLSSWWKNHEMVFVRNPSWRGWKANPADGDSEPFDTIRYLVVDDASTQWLMFLNGQLDFLGEISRDNWDAVVDANGRIDPRLEAQGVTLHCMNALDVRYIGFNMRDPVLGPNKKLRQALSCAFDAPAWCAFLNNRALPANGPVPPGVDGRLDEPNPYAFNLAKAHRLMAEAGYRNGVDPATGRRLILSLAIGRPTQDARETGELVADFFGRIGVNLELRFFTWEAFLRAVNEGRVQMCMMGWNGDYPDAENFLQLFHSRNVSPGANHSYYVNPAYDAAFDAAMEARTAEERRAHWATCQRILREDCPWIFAHHSRAYSLTRARVLDYVPSDFPYGQEAYLRAKKEETVK
ncbi:MAG TPA: hypothetical protein DD637_05335 [Verrucomicrobia bacterium]|nr:hypothetical protein [Verrucomicrobiota bacterium]HCG20465.1 hypothetical protein [Verrucomicrobiota bacterium]